MTIQDLIDQLLLVEDKTSSVINEYDGSYNVFKSLANIILYTSDDCLNLYDNIDEAVAMKDEDSDIMIKHCVLIDTSNGEKLFSSDRQEYFYTK